MTYYSIAKGYYDDLNYNQKKHIQVLISLNMKSHRELTRNEIFVNVIFKYFQNHHQLTSFKEIAFELNITESEARWTFNNAMVKLKKLFKNNENFKKELRSSGFLI